MIPLLICPKISAPLLKGSRVVCYLDHDGAKHSMIRTFAGSAFAERVIEAFLLLETSLELKTWFSRVPTSCNIPDNPSRLERLEFRLFKKRCCQVCCALGLFPSVSKRGVGRRHGLWHPILKKRAGADSELFIIICCRCSFRLHFLAGKVLLARKKLYLLPLCKEGIRVYSFKPPDAERMNSLFSFASCSF